MLPSPCGATTTRCGLLPRSAVAPLEQWTPANALPGGAGKPHRQRNHFLTKSPLEIHYETSFWIWVHPTRPQAVGSHANVEVLNLLARRRRRSGRWQYGERIQPQIFLGLTDSREARASTRTFSLRCR